MNTCSRPSSLAPYVRSMSASSRRASRVRQAAQAPLATASVMDGTRRPCARRINARWIIFDAHLASWRTVGSVSPIHRPARDRVGIMNAFRGLANVHQATLANVAPGIAEALIATAIGLFAAIPAVVAFNYYARESTPCPALTKRSWRSSPTSPAAGRGGLRIYP